MLSNFLETAALVMKLGGEVSFECPKCCLGGLLQELIDFIIRYELYVAEVLGCALGTRDPDGVPVLKQLQFVTTSKRIAETLNAIRCPHPKDFQHGEIGGGSFTKSTERYSEKLCRAR